MVKDAFEFRACLRAAVWMLSILLAACPLNLPPHADAGPDKTALKGTPVFLDGSDSSDPNGDTLTFFWSFETLPEGSAATLSEANADAVSFEVDIAGTYVVRLEVDDGELSDADTVTIHVTDGGVGFDHSTVTGVCLDCHDGVAATGKPANHIAASDQCDACHSTDVWMPLVQVDHAAVIGTCQSCHDGIVATGKSAQHIPTDAACDTCHGTAAWSPTIGTGGDTGTGKPAGHIASSERCEACHTTPGEPATVDHNEVFGICSSCHTKPAQHVATNLECNACHAPAGWLPAGGGSGEPALKPADHIPSTDLCSACHSGPGFLPVLQVDHTQVLGTCADCHDGTTAVGKSATHIAATDRCGACHRTGRWVPVFRVDHDEVTGTCMSCHDGVIARGKPADHIRTSRDCDVCHNTREWE